MPEEPVIVTGGSVTVEFNNEKFKANGSAGGGNSQHKHSGGRLRRVEVNGRKVADLNENDRVEIIYED